MIDRIAKEVRSKIMRSVKSKNTKPELLVRKILTQAGYRYRLHVKDILGKPDIVFKGKGKLIFIHGCFWHGHSNCSRGAAADSEFWREKIKGNIMRDKYVLDRLERDEWAVLIIWECELRNVELVKNKLSNFLDC